MLHLPPYEKTLTKESKIGIATAVLWQSSSPDNQKHISRIVLEMAATYRIILTPHFSALYLSPWLWCAVHLVDYFFFGPLIIDWVALSVWSHLPSLHRIWRPCSEGGMFRCCFLMMELCSQAMRHHTHTMAIRGYKADSHHLHWWHLGESMHSSNRTHGSRHALTLGSLATEEKCDGWFNRSDGMLIWRTGSHISLHIL